MSYRQCSFLIRSFLVCAAWMLFGATGYAQADAKRKLEFNRDIRPILSENCFVCHGPDNKLRKGDLRLDEAKAVYEDRGGYKIVVPGEPQKSELYVRITADHAARIMPPPKSKKKLSDKEVAMLRTWIEQGGEYQGHWSLIPAKRPPLPRVKNNKWVRNKIDQFILAELESEKIQPSPEAQRRDLIRRLAFDLTGLPPTVEQVEQFLADKSDKAYEKLVEKFLNSPHFGERMALYWLDVVRYADTGGYHSDNHRDVWMFRDYVIDAFNNNKPFDQFLIEQLAGDLLPNATDEQRIASGFNRLLQTTEEGGAQPKEYQAKYYADRVRNTSSIFLGITMGCAECHDHKFDPFTTKEFYEFEAFFADIQERSVGRQPQTPFPTPEQEAELQKLNSIIALMQKRLNAATKAQKAQNSDWEQELKDKKYKGVPKNVANILKIAAAKRNGKQKQAVLDYFQSTNPQLKPIREKLSQLKAKQASVKKKVPTTLVSLSGTPKTIRVLPRGNWLDDSGEIVMPDVPEAILPLKVEKKRATRLDLAKWMVAKENPLVARVFVNRLWMLFYGRGIVKSVDDFGSQGTWPTHPALLDWLAIEFQESGWDIKHMIRLMVTSNTYRQTSKVREDLAKRDPYNELFARQARYRIEAEMVRDSVLAISGLLNREIGGPSVKPYQPAGYWKHLNFPKRKWTPDRGDDQYRRGLYTYWQRTFLHPSLLAFDAPTREECTPQRPKSNTPQQALVLLNDPTYVEAARVYAEKILRTKKKDVESRIQHAFRHALFRNATPDEMKILKSVYLKHLQDYQSNVKAAEQLISVGFYPTANNLPAAELAAMTSVCRVVLNLHETITRN